MPHPRLRRARPSARARLIGALASFAAIPPVVLGAGALLCDCPAHEHGTTGAGIASSSAAAHAAHLMNASWVVNDDPTATRLATVITTREATEQLSKRCRTLIKVKRRSSLSTSERRKRLQCVRQRREIVQRSIAEATGKVPATTQPNSAVAVATPTPAPGSAPAPGATPTPAPTSTPVPKGACASVQNAVYAAVGVDAYDDGGRLYFQLTRGTVTADCVSFELRNHDSQPHNLFIQERGKPSTTKPVIVNLEPGQGGTVTRASAELKLAPGAYTLRCVIPGHEAMTVDFTVVAPAR